MGKEVAAWSLLLLLLHFILLFMLAHGHGFHENHHSILKMPSMSSRGNDKNDQEQSKNRAAEQNPTSQMHNHHQHHQHLDLSSAIFFKIDDLGKGKTLPLAFPKIDPLTAPPLLPREQAESIPLSSKSLPFLLKLFSAQEGSRLARAIKEGVKNCEDEAIRGETKFCATSLESMIDFAKRILGQHSHIRVLKTTHLTKLRMTILKNYTIQETPQEIPTPIMVACHTMVYPYTIFYCHGQEDTKVFKVQLANENGERTEAAAACHLDTAHWDVHHAAFKMLGVAAGTPVCHVFPEDNILWVPAPAIEEN